MENTTFTLETFNNAINRNMKATEDNVRIIEQLNESGATVEHVRQFLTSPDSMTKGHILRKFASWYYDTTGKKARRTHKTTPETKQETTPETKKETKKEVTPEESAETLRRVLSDFIGTRTTTTEIDIDTITKIVDERLQNVIESIKPKATEIVVKVAEHANKIKGTPHYMLTDILADLASGENAYIFGPAGTGKTVLAQQVAEALGVPFYFTGKVDEVFQLTGFIDANSHYNETELYRCMTTGGVFLFDEMDASAPEALTAFNALLANGVMDFPTGKIKKPENMYIIGAGNTNGRGGTAQYNTRQPIDEATLDRFVMEKVYYDPKIENAIAESFPEYGADARDIVRVIRSFAESNGVEIIASYRTITRLGKLAQVKGVAKTVISCIVNKMSDDDYLTLANSREMKKLAERGNVFAMAICN